MFCSRFVCNGEKNFTIVRIKTNRPLEVGEEVTFSHADDYFQIGECKCQNCNDSSIIEHVGLEESPDKRPLSEELQQPHFHGWSNLFSGDYDFIFYLTQSNRIITSQFVSIFCFDKFYRNRKKVTT